MVFRAISLLLITLLAALTVYVWRLPGVLPAELGTLAQDVSLEPEVGSQTARELLREADEAVRDDRFDVAERLYLRLVDTTADVSAGRAWALVGLGRVAKHRGMMYTALRQYREALRLFRALGDRRGESVVLHNLGAAFVAVGEQELARDQYRLALDARTNDAELAITLTHIATLDDLAGDHALAIENFQQALELRRTNRAERPEHQLRGMASILDRLGSALSYLEPEDCPSESCRVLTRRAYESALEIARSLANSRDTVHSTSNLGWLALEHCEAGGARLRSEGWQSTCHEAADHFGEALARLESLDASDDLAAALLTGYSESLRHVGELEEAERAARKGLEAVERLRVEELEDRHLRTSFLARHQPLFEELVTILARRHRREPEAGHALAALAVAEQARGRDLLDRLVAEDLDGGWTAPDGDPALAELNRFESDRLELLDRMRCSGEPEAIGRLRDEIAEIERQQRELIVSASAVTVTSFLPPPPDLAAIRRQLADDTALLVYKLAAEASFLWWIDGERFELFELPDTASLTRWTQTVFDAIADGATPRTDARRRDDEATASRLADALLAPVAARLAAPGAPGRLVVLPDGALHALPFAALPHPADGRPLVLRHELATLPSLAAWEALAARERGRVLRASRVRQLVLVADAVYSADDPRLGAGAEEKACIPPTALPASAGEAAAIRRLVAPELYTEHLGFAARRELLIDGGLAGSAIVHLAVHGELEARRPELSHLLFSRFDATGESIESRVFTHELDDLPLDADLVVVSACDSGRGKIVRGEGVVGMTQALLAAGASRAVVSLWSVGDQATAELMKLFYQGLLRDAMPPSTALADAQRQLRERPEFAAPFYWASFLLVGDWHWQANNPAAPVFSPGEPRTF